MDKVRSGRRVVVGAVAIGAMLSSSALAGGGANWSSSGYDIENTRYNSTEHTIGVDNVDDLDVAWKVATNGDVSATPAVDGQTVYFPDFSGDLYAVDRDTGAIKWKKNFVTDYGLPSGPGFVDHARATPAIAGNLLIVGDQLGKMHPFVSEGNILAIDKRTGQLVWRTTFPDVAPIVTQAAVVMGDVAYVGVASFEELWARFLPPDLCCFFRGSVMALDVKTGAILWRTYTAPPNPPTPNANDGYTGNAVWGSTPAIDPSRGQLYVATGNNYSVPDSLLDCIEEHPDNAESCVDPDEPLRFDHGARPRHGCHQMGDACTAARCLECFLRHPVHLRRRDGELSGRSRARLGLRPGTLTVHGRRRRR